ncbi:MAG: Tim44-like domain-containing protein [Burkholderiaceae bacterium]|nr:Tim44-like domain-containing protein [Burkholderiaceae bacterium]
MISINLKDSRMKPWWIGALALVVAVGLTPPEAQAKRLGSGGMQRSMPAQPAKPAPANQNAAPAQPGTPAQQAAPATAGAAAAATGAAAQAGKRSWMGPIAGLAAGLGLAALLSHFGMGEAVANFLMMALLAVAAIFLVTWLMRRFAGNKAGRGAVASGLQPAYAGAGAGTGDAGGPFGQREAEQPVMARQAMFPSSGASAAPGSAAASFASPQASAPAAAELPADFDRAGFERVAQLIFIRMQAANDRCDLNDLRQFTTPEMFASIRLDLQNRGDSAQQTDVVQVQAEVLDLAQEGDRDIVSVRYHGLIREEPGQPASAFDEVWHLVRPRDGSAEWAIAGIQTTQ